MTACFKLMNVFQQQPRLTPEEFCSSCVYFSKNLDKTEYPVLMVQQDQCGLGFSSGDANCSEMRTDNCSVRRK